MDSDTTSDVPAPSNNRLGAPPSGFESWLEYAILTFSGHWVALDYMFDDDPIERHDIEARVLEEFNELRVLANLPPLDPNSRRHNT